MLVTVTVRLAAMQRNVNRRANKMTATVECSALSDRQNDKLNITLMHISDKFVLYTKSKTYKM